MADIEKIAEILPAFLNRGDIKPADDFREEGPIPIPPLLGAEIGDVPGGHQQLPVFPPGNQAGLFVGAEALNFSGDVVFEGEFGLGENRHNASFSLHEIVSKSGHGSTSSPRTDTTD
jgi:hypothetical protein